MTRRIALAGGLALAVSALTLIAAPVVGATTYHNDTPIIMPAAVGNADPYGSSITVSGAAGPITDVNVGLDGFTHTQPDEVAIALVAPSGQALMVQGCAGGGTDAAGVFLTFDDPAGPLPDPLTTGTFRPTSFCGGTPSFPAPGPLMSYGNPGPSGGGTATFASVFNGLSAIGTWNLFVRDYGTGGSGSIPGGWSLDVKPDVTPLPEVTPMSAPGLTCGTGTVQQGSQCVVKKKKKKKRKKKPKKK